MSTQKGLLRATEETSGLEGLGIQLGVQNPEGNKLPIYQKNRNECISWLLLLEAKDRKRG